MKAPVEPASATFRQCRLASSSARSRRSADRPRGRGFGPRPAGPAGLLPGTALQQALQGRRDLDLALLPGESVNDDGLFIDSMRLDLLASTVAVEVRVSKDFTDALLQNWLRSRTQRFAEIARQDPDPVKRLQMLISNVSEFNHRAEAAIRVWAGVDDRVAAIQREVDEGRYQAAHEALVSIVGPELAPAFAVWGLSTAVGYEMLSDLHPAEHRDAGPVGGNWFEHVRRHAGTDAAHVYGGLLATLTSWCELRGIPYAAIPVGTIKKHATGKGNGKHVVFLAVSAFWNVTIGCALPMTMRSIGWSKRL